MIEKIGGVVMTAQAVADDLLGKIALRQWELFRRVKEGTLNPEVVLSEIQCMIQGEIALPVLLVDWENFYGQVFQMSVSFSKLIVPPRQRGFNRLVIMAPGMTAQRLYRKCIDLFPSWAAKDCNLDFLVRNERSHRKTSYAVWFRDRVEADEEEIRSAYRLSAEGEPCITLEERILLELKFFKETERHLDLTRFTKCAGSRFSDGYVPVAGYKNRLFWIDRCRPDDVNVASRARVAVL